MADNTTRVTVRPDDPTAHIDTEVIDRYATALLGGSIVRDHWRSGAPTTILVTKSRFGGWTGGTIGEIAAACAAVAVDGGTGDRDELLFHAPEFVAELVEHTIGVLVDAGIRHERAAHVGGVTDFDRLAEAMAALHAAERTGGGIWAWKESWSLDAARRIVDICADARCSPAALVQLAPQDLLRRWNEDRLVSLIPLARTAFAPTGATA